MEHQKKALFLNTFISASGRILGIVVTVIATALVTRALGTVGFGEYSLVMAVLSVFYVIADLGLGQLFAKEIAKDSFGARSVVASEIFTLRLVLLGGALALAPLAAVLLSYSPAVAWGTLVAAAGFFFSSLSQLLMGIFQRVRRMGPVAIAELTGRAAQLAGAAVLFFTRSTNLLAFLGVFVLGSFIQFVIMAVAGRRLIPIGLRWGGENWYGVLKEAFPIGASLVFVYIYFRTDMIILSLYHPGAPVGFYGLAYKVLENLIFFPAMFVGLVFPELTRAWQIEKSRFRLIFRSTMMLLAIAGPLVGVGTAVFAPFIMQALGGPGFAPAVAALRILAVAVFFIYLATLAGQAIVAMGLQKRALWLYLGGAVVNVALNLIFIPRYSFIAAAWTTVVTEAMVTAGLYIIVWKTLRAASSV